MNVEALTIHHHTTKNIDILAALQSIISQDKRTINKPTRHDNHPLKWSSNSPMTAQKLSKPYSDVNTKNNKNAVKIR